MCSAAFDFPKRVPRALSWRHMPTLLQEPILRGNEDGCEMVAKDLCTGFGRRSSNLVSDKGTVDKLCVWFLVLGAGVK